LEQVKVQIECVRPYNHKGTRMCVVHFHVWILRFNFICSSFHPQV